MSDSVEFYKVGSQLPFLMVESNFQPNDNDVISIKGQTYMVLGRSFSVDYADDSRLKRIRCNVIVKEVEAKAGGAG